MFTRLFVGNLSFQATEEDVRELFQHAGTLGSVRIVTDQFTGRYSRFSSGDHRMVGVREARRQTL
jgi:RNA recognition motif-containing protein